MSTEHLKHGHGEGGTPLHNDVAYEKTDVRVSPILKFIFYLGITVIASYFLVLGVYRGLTNYWRADYTPMPPSRVGQGATMPPEPRLQGMPGHLTDPQEDMREKVKADTEANETLGWIDQQAGVAQIPVKDAMKLIAEKGLPAIATPPAEKK